MITEKETLILNTLIESIYPSQFKGLTTKIKYLYPSIYMDLKQIKDKYNLKTMSECIYLVINGLNEPPKCSHISKNCKQNLKFKNIIEGYYPYCKACSSANDDFLQSRLETNMERYGTMYPTQNQNILNKIKNTVLEKYNVTNVKQIKKV